MSILIDSLIEYHEGISREEHPFFATAKGRKQYGIYLSGEYPKKYSKTLQSKLRDCKRILLGRSIAIHYQEDQPEGSPRRSPEE